MLTKKTKKNKKLSELPYFESRETAIALMERGLSLTDYKITDATSVLVLGLVDVLVEKGILETDDERS